MSNILIGTASWTDKSLITSGRFYPPKCSTPEDRLRYYSSQFPLVEVDSSYYAMPKPEVAQLWAERTPPDRVPPERRARTARTDPPAGADRRPPPDRRPTERPPARGSRPT